MNIHDLANELRQRIRQKHLLSEEQIAGVSDMDVITSYARCAMCGKVQYEAHELAESVDLAEDAADFLMLVQPFECCGQLVVPQELTEFVEAAIETEILEHFGECTEAVIAKVVYIKEIDGERALVTPSPDDVIDCVIDAVKELRMETGAEPSHDAVIQRAANRIEQARRKSSSPGTRIQVKDNPNAKDDLLRLRERRESDKRRARRKQQRHARKHNRKRQ